VTDIDHNPEPDPRALRQLCVNKECPFYNLASYLPGPKHGLCASCASKELDRLQGLVRELLNARLKLSIAKLGSWGKETTVTAFDLDLTYGAVGIAFAKLTEAVGT
jgi:hypothetical protein